MKKITYYLLLLMPFVGLGQEIVTEDIDRFWTMYDQVVVEKDTLKQLELVQKLYIQKGTPGLDGIMRARRYTDQEYRYAITHYPKFWQSIRANTLKSKQFSNDIKLAVKKLKNIYPDLKPVNIYFEIGVLRTGGTTIDGMLLIGSEIALADKLTITNEFEDRYPHLRTYFDTAPITNVSFLNIHEYIHTQQKETIGNTLLAQTILEGVAEFLAEIALNQKSPNPQIDFGYKNEVQIKQAYTKEMFSPNIYNWIMNDSKNEFGMRDLGYFVGYAICKKYYDQAKNKQLAVKEMIELDYNNPKKLIAFVEKTKYFSKSLNQYQLDFEQKRPKVLAIKEIKNGSQNIDPTTNTFTLTFSEAMHPDYRNFELGPLGEANLLKITKVIGFSEDKKSFTFEASLAPNQQYQLVVNYGFTSLNGYPLIPYLIDFKTSK